MAFCSCKYQASRYFKIHKLQIVTYQILAQHNLPKHIHMGINTLVPYLLKFEIKIMLKY